MVNLVKRIKAGGKLTREERSMLQSLAAGGKPVTTGKVDNYTALAEALNVSRRQLQTWRKLPGAPKPDPNGQHSVDVWRNFCTLNNLKGGEVLDLDETALRARKLLAETEEKEIRVAIRKREWVRMDEVAETWATGVGQAVNLLRKKFENELPPILSGLDAPAIQLECRKAIDEVLALLNSGNVEESPFETASLDALEVELVGRDDEGEEP